MDVEQERQKSYYDRSKYGPSYKVGREVLVFNPTVKKGETRKFTSFYRGPYLTVENINDLNCKVEDKKTRKAIKVHYDRLKKYKTPEKPFTPEPQAKRKTTIKEQKNSDLNSADDGDIIELESSTDSESNLNTENHSEAEDANDSLNVTNETSENEAKESEQETCEGQEKAQNVPEGGGATSSKATEYTEKKTSRNKNSKSRKKQQESSSKTKSTEESINSNPKAPKMATRSSIRLKLVPERLNNYFTEQDEEYFSSQETDLVFVSGKSRKKLWNRKKDEFVWSIVMEYHYVFISHC